MTDNEFDRQARAESAFRAYLNADAQQPLGTGIDPAGIHRRLRNRRIGLGVAGVGVVAAAAALALIIPGGINLAGTVPAEPVGSPSQGASAQGWVRIADAPGIGAKQEYKGIVAQEMELIDGNYYQVGLAEGVASAYKYDPVADAWTTGSEFQTDFTGSADEWRVVSKVVGADIYVVAYQSTEDGKREITVKTLVYHPASDSWEQFADLQASAVQQVMAFPQAVAVVSDELIFYWDAQDVYDAEGTQGRDAWSFSTETKKWTKHHMSGDKIITGISDAPSGSYWAESGALATASIADKKGERRDSLVRLDPRTWGIDPLTDFPAECDTYETYTDDGYVIASGVRADADPENPWVLCSYDVEKSSWTSGITLPAQGAVESDPEWFRPLAKQAGLVVHGGFAYQPSSASWYAVTPLPLPVSDLPAGVAGTALTATPENMLACVVDIPDGTESGSPAPTPTATLQPGLAGSCYYRETGPVQDYLTKVDVAAVNDVDRSVVLSLGADNPDPECSYKGGPCKYLHVKTTGFTGSYECRWESSGVGYEDGQPEPSQYPISGTQQDPDGIFDHYMTGDLDVDSELTVSDNYEEIWVTCGEVHAQFKP